MKTIRIHILFIAVLVMAFLSACSSEVETQPIDIPPAQPPSVITNEQTAQTAPSTLSSSFSFWGTQIDIENLPEYIPHRNVLLSIQNLSEPERELYILFAQIYQHLHSGDFDFVSAYQQSTASNMFGNDVFAVFDFTAPAGKTIFDYMPIFDLFYATQAEIYYLDIHEIFYMGEKERLTFGMRLSNMHQFTATVYALNESIIRHNEYIETFYQELREMIFPGSSRYEIVKTIYYALIDSVAYDFSLSAISGTIAGAVNPNIRSVICNGYARTLFYYLSRFDIPCLIVLGDAGGEGHAWNYVQMDDGKWYLLDATWDDTGDSVSFDFFLVGARATSASHSPWQISSLENIVLEYYNYPMPGAVVYEVDLQLYVGGSFELPSLNINYNDYWYLVYITDHVVLGFRDIRSIRSFDDTSISQLFVNNEGHVYTQIPATMIGLFCGTEFNTSGKYITIILTHSTTGEKITIPFTRPIG